LVLHFTILGLSLFSASYSTQVFMLLRGLAVSERVMKFVGLNSDLSGVYPFLAIGIVVLARPLFEADRRAAKHPPRPRQRLFSIAAWIMFSTILVAAPVAVVTEIFRELGGASSSQGLSVRTISVRIRNGEIGLQLHQWRGNSPRQCPR
jgi:hypothetical protein